MKTVSLSNFSNGVQAPRAQVTGGCISSRHFMLESTKLIPYRDMETESLDTGTLADQRLTDVIRFIPTSQPQQLFALGQVSTANPYPKFYQKSTTDTVSASFQAIANGEDSSGVVIPGTLIGYKGALYCLKTRNGYTYLVKHVYATSTTEFGTFLGLSPSNGVVPQMFIHPKDNRLYMASGYTVGSFDGTTLSTRDFSTGHDITSITYYGNNIMLGMVSRDGNSSVMAVWDGSTTSSVLVDVVEFGNDTLLVLENVGDTVIGISGISVGGSSGSGIYNTITIRSYAGGTAQVIREIESIGLLGSRVYPLKAKRNNVLYFPMSAYLNGTRTNQIWCVYKNEAGNFVVTPDIKPNNNSELVSEDVIGLSSVGDYKWVAFSSSSSTGSIFRTNDTNSFTSTSSWTSLVNPGVEVGDRSKKKQLKAVSLRCGSPAASSHTVTLSYSADGGAFTTIYTGASSSIVRVIEEVAQADRKPFLEAREYIFKIETTGNGEIYELKYAYEVKPTLI
jgi:hypothetical protein